MPSAGNWLGACSASKEALRNVNNKSPIIDDGEKVEKEVRNIGDAHKSADVRQMVGSVTADRRLVVTEALSTTQKLRNSAD